MEKIFKIRMLQSSQEVILNFSKRYQEAAKIRYSDPPLYKATLERLFHDEELRRYRLAQFIGNDPVKIANMHKYYSRREAIIDWMVDWGWTTDPRNAPLGLPTVIPMIPFLRQIEMIEWVYNLYLQQKGGIVEKSREMGVTWLFCFIFMREWRYEHGFSAGIGSRKVTLVDDKDNPKAIFAKIRTIISSQPSWWLSGYDDKKHDKIANIRNPFNGGTISGEGGDDIGRGDRRSMYLVDEAAYLEHPQRADAALSQTTQSQFDVSSYCGPNYFYQKVISGRVEVFPFDWRDDPRKNQEWHDHEEARLDPVILAQEIDRNPMASVGNLFIPPEWVDAAVDLDLPDYGTVGAGLDVAAGGKNKSALAIKRGCRLTVENYNYKNGVDLTYKAIEVCNDMGVDYLNYDPDGVGHSVHSTIERTTIPLGFEYFPMRAGDSPSDKFYEEFGRFAKEIFFNAKSESWYNLSVLFKNTWEYVKHGIQHDPAEMISISNNGLLRTQLSTPQKIWKNNGKIMVEPKEMLAARGVLSPDEADAAVLANIPKDTAFKRVWSTYNSSHYKDVKIDFKNIDVPFSKLFVVLLYDKDTGVYGHVYFWGRKSRALRVYAEIHHPNPVIEILVNDIKEQAKVPIVSGNESNPHINKIYGSDGMFENKGSKEMFDWAYVLRTKGAMRIHKLTNYNESAAIVVARSMFARNQIIIDDTLSQTNQQIKNWRIVDSKPQDGYQYCRTLCMVISELREAGELSEDSMSAFEKPYSKSKQKIRERLRGGENPYLFSGRTPSVTNKNSEYEYLLK